MNDEIAETHHGLKPEAEKCSLSLRDARKLPPVSSVLRPLDAGLLPASDFNPWQTVENYEERLRALTFGTVGIVEALTLSPVPDTHLLVRTLRVLPESGVEGQYPGKQWWQGRRIPGRQISAMNAEVLDALGVSYEVPGDNLIVRGLDLSRFAPGDTLRVGDALLTVTPTRHRPCAKLARRTSPAKMEAIKNSGRRGLLLDARAPALISVGDPVDQIVFD